VSTHDCRGTLRRFPIIGDPRESPPQLDGSRKLATTIERGADRGSIFLTDDKHSSSMET
jgi:hypothetical protein